jgi:hypothetical protein
MGDNQMDTPTTLDPKKKKVINLMPPQPNAPNEKVIKALRETLVEAKKGNIQAIGIAIATIDPDGDGGRATESILSSADGWYHSLTTAVCGLAFRLQYERFTAGGILPDAPELKDDDE